MDDFQGIRWEDQTEHQSTGYFVVCDLAYPEHLHDAHRDFPLAPEHVDITFSTLSPKAKGERQRKR